MKKIKDWIKGMCKINYTVPLQNDFIMTDDISNHLEAVSESIIKQIEDLPIKDTRFKILRFEACKEPHDNKMLNKIRRQQKPIVRINVALDNTRITGNKTIDVLTNVYCLGIDRKIWNFEIQVSSRYRCRCFGHDKEMINYCIDYINEFIKVMKLEYMVSHNIFINTINNFDGITKEHYDGYTFSVDNTIDNDEYYNENINEIYDSFLGSIKEIVTDVVRQK